MKTDKVIAFAKQVDADFDGSDWNFGAAFDGDQLQRFAALVRDDALDEAAKASETQWITSSEKMYGVEFAAYLRSMK